MTILTPATETEAAEIICATKAPLRIEGGGSKAALGRPISGDTLSSKALSGITLYEPSEMVISAKAGTPLAEIEAAIAAKGQMLSFEPLDFAAIFGVGAPTIGGLAACNVSGPRRIAAGAARDSIIGLRLVNGSGEIIKTGGRVMKNVTGLDLVKVNCGAYGTLGFLTEVTLKLLPRPERAVSLILKGLSDDAAIAALSTALGSPFEISGAAHLPAGLGRDYARTLIRMENFTASIDYRMAELRKLFASGDECHTLEGDAADRMWRSIGNAEFVAAQQPFLWKISCAPSAGAKITAALKDLNGSHFYDWGGGLIWLSLDAPHADRIRAALAPFGGHATLIRAPEAVRAIVPVFQPLSAAQLALTKAVKASFDPRSVLNFGKMYEGI